jgi:hypothetical protein
LQKKTCNTFRWGQLPTLDRAGIAQRLRELLGGQDQGDLKRIAERLGVEEVSLRMSVDELSPHPTVEVLTAMIQAYGIDPTWLLTGKYNSATHRNAIESDNVANTVRTLIGTRPVRIAEPPYERATLHEQN